MTERRRRRSRRRKKRLPVILGIIACLLVFGCAYGFASGWWIPGPSGPIDHGLVSNIGGKEKLEGFNILLLGTDDRESTDSYSRTDTIIVLNYNDEANRMSMLSIPRDTRVQVPGHGMDKVNSANVYGGPELTVKTVSQLIGVPIEYYVLTNFYGFKDIVDALGGVTLDVDKNMYHSERAYGGEYNINLKEGTQRLDGDKALQFVRYRGDAHGDITRTGRQLKFLQALAAETMQPKTITKLHKLVPEIYENVETNVGLSQLITLAKAGRNLDSVEMVTQTLPGHFLDTAYGSYWAVDQDQAKRVAEALFEEGKVVKEVVQQPTETLSSVSQSQDREVMVSQNSSREKTESVTESRHRNSFTDQERPRGDTSKGLEQVNEPDGSTDSGDGNNDEQSRPDSSGGIKIIEPPARESIPPQGLPVERSDQDKVDQSSSDRDKVEIIIDIDHG